MHSKYLQKYNCHTPTHGSQDMTTAAATRERIPHHPTLDKIPRINNFKQQVQIR